MLKYSGKLYRWSILTTQAVKQTVTFVNLNPSTKYTLFYVATNDDPSINALESTILAFTFTTLSEAISLTVSTAPHLAPLALLLSLLLLLLL